jgi:NAD(P)-dependent dehydrogenase (short-subunit alcohol dehydrogenase family)
MSNGRQRVALVTGGASGLGKAMAKRLVTDGLQVVITDLRPEAGEAGAVEVGAVFIQQDVCDEERWPAVLLEIESLFGHVDVVVNNAGISGSMEGVTPESTPFEEWRKVFAVNADSVFLGCRAAIPALRRAGGGSIVNTASVASFRAAPDSLAYGASKAVVRHLTKSVATYCAQRRLNIRCNSVHPGIVRTPLWEVYAAAAAERRGVTLDQVADEAGAAVPLGDWTTPEDVANAVSFLVSDDARHITGMAMIVDGGYINCDTFVPPVSD